MTLDDWQVVGYAVGGCLATVIAIVDLRQHRIPNPMVFALLLVGLASTVPAADAAWPLLAPVVLGGALAALRASSRGAVAGGDVKLGVALGPYLGWFGPGPVLLAVAAGFVLAVPHAAMLIIRRADSGVPFGPYLVAASVIVVVIAS